jgi:hypothetical protein
MACLCSSQHVMRMRGRGGSTSRLCEPTQTATYRVVQQKGMKTEKWRLHSVHAACSYCGNVVGRRGEERGTERAEKRVHTKKCWRVREGQDPSEGWHIDSAATHLSGSNTDLLSPEAILGLSRERSFISVASAMWGEARVKRGEGLVRRS